MTGRAEGRRAQVCLRFTAFLITPHICKAPQGGLQASQRHGFKSKLSLKLEMSKMDFVWFLQQAWEVETLPFYLQAFLLHFQGAEMASLQIWMMLWGSETRKTEIREHPSVAHEAAQPPRITSCWSCLLVSHAHGKGSLHTQVWTPGFWPFLRTLDCHTAIIYVHNLLHYISDTEEGISANLLLRVGEDNQYQWQHWWNLCWEEWVQSSVWTFS